MTTVGYGDIYAVSQFGRVISILNALWGSFIIAMLVGTIGFIFNMNDNQKKAVCEITNAKHAGASLRTYIKYINAK
jgi:voltage-gated potassium channel